LGAGAVPDTAWNPKILPKLWGGGEKKGRGNWLHAWGKTGRAGGIFFPP